MSLAQALKTKKMEMLQKTRRSSSSTTNNFKKLTQKFSLPKEDQKANAKNNTGFSVLHDQENNRSTDQNKNNDDGNFESKYADEYFFKKISSLELEIGEQPSRKSFDSLDRNFTKSENTDFEDTNELSRRFREIREKVRRSPNTYKSFSGSYKSSNTIKIDPTKSTNPESANNYTSNTKSEQQIIPKKPLNKRQQREQEQLAKLAALEKKNYANFKTVNQPTSELARKLSRTLSNSKNIESSKENSSDKSEDSQNNDNHHSQVQNLDVKMVKKIKTPQNIRPTIPAVASNITSELQRKLSKRINSIENHEIRQSRNSSRNISTEVLDRQPSFEDNQSIGNNHKLLTKRVSGSSLCSRRKNIQASFERHNNNNKDQTSVLKNNEYNEDFPACYPHFDISASAVEPDKTNSNQNSKIIIRRKISTISNTDSLSHVSHVSEIEDRDVIVRTTSHKSQHEIDSFGVPVQDALAFFERKGGQ